jgi:TonB family protein
MKQLSEVVVTGYSTTASSDDFEDEFEMAAPEEGRKAFNEYLKNQLQYPQAAIENKIEGKVTVQFFVETNGQLTDFKVVKGIGYGCDEELIRLIKQGPKWTPSLKNGISVRERVKVRLRFVLPK